MKLTRILVPGIAFAAGFLVHAVFFPYMFVDGKSALIEETVKTVAGKTPKDVPPEVENDLITYVKYNNNRFQPASVVITRGNYIAITNISQKEQMHLTSDNPLLSTKRGYAYGERLQLVLAEPGTYTVENALSPGNKLSVVVK